MVLRDAAREPTGVALAATGVLTSSHAERDATSPPAARGAGGGALAPDPTATLALRAAESRKEANERGEKRPTRR